MCAEPSWVGEPFPTVNAKTLNVGILIRGIRFQWKHLVFTNAINKGYMVLHMFVCIWFLKTIKGVLTYSAIELIFLALLWLFNWWAKFGQRIKLFKLRLTFFGNFQMTTLCISSFLIWNNKVLSFLEIVLKIFLHFFLHWWFSNTTNL